MSLGQFSTVLLASLVMAFRVVSMGLGGYLLVKWNIIEKDFIRQLGQVIAYFLMPCLIFGKLISTFSIADWQAWLPILLSTYFCIFLGLALGYLISRFIFRFKRASQHKLISVIIGFCHAGSINITLIISLQDTLNEIGHKTGTYRILEKDDTPAERAMGYVILAWVLTVALRWSLGYYMLAPTELEIIQRRQTIGRLSDPHELLIKANKEPFVDAILQREAKAIMNFERDVFGLDPPEMSCKQRCKKTLNLPMIVSLISLLLASIPAIKGLFVPEGAVFYSTVTSTANFIGSANYIMMIILLGANLSVYRGEFNEISTLVHFLVGGFRMLLFPLIGLGIVYGFFKAGAIVDPMLAFTMMLLYATPPANNLMVMANLHHNLESDLARSLLITYVASILTLTLYTALFLYMIQN